MSKKTKIQKALEELIAAMKKQQAYDLPTRDGQEVVLLRFFYRFPEGARLGLAGWKDIAEITLPVRS